jgi:hypothetical protein
MYRKIMKFVKEYIFVDDCSVSKSFKLNKLNENEKVKLFI